VAALLPIMAVVVVAYLVTRVAMPVLPLHVHEGLGLGTLVLGLVAGTQFAATLISRLWPGYHAGSMTRRELLAGTAAAGALLVGGQHMSGIISRAGAQATGAALASLDVTLRVNGTEHRLLLDPRTTLLDALREYLHLTGSKKGCGLGQCGACTVLMDGKRVKSCLSLAALAEGREITTIEGLAQAEELHPLQAAFIERDAFQCGYCTSGQIMSGVACIAEGHAGSPQEIRDWMSGNLCRCGAYDHIVAAIQDAARATGPVRGG
jgi:xanthine dehydrogenase YagT iron-sulfur-binding subunit